MDLHGLTTVNIELTSRCNKACFMCGRRKLDLDRGDMPFALVSKISKKIPPGIVVQFHWNGEPLVYPHLGVVLGGQMFKKQIRCLNTNGKLLMEKRWDLLHLDTLTISVIQDDPEGDEQYDIVREFVDWKGDRPPLMIYRLLGDIFHRGRWERLPGTITNRTIHDPMGSRYYEKPVTKPEIGICLDLLSHPAIDRHGRVSLCVRFDPEGVGVIGNCTTESLEAIWSGAKRRAAIEYHKAGQRDKVAICAKCDYWGVPGG